MSNLRIRVKRLKLIRAGFTDREIETFGLLDASEEEIASFLSSSFSWRSFFPKLNGKQQQVLNDKLVAQQFLSSMGLPAPELIGTWHPHFGMSSDGSDMHTPEQLARTIRQNMKDSRNLELFFKPRSGRFGENSFPVMAVRSGDDIGMQREGGELQSISDFLSGLPGETFSHFGKASPSWIIQKRIPQHPRLAELNQSSINTFRIITYVRPESACPDDEPIVELDMIYLRVGRRGSSTDGWNKGGGLVIEIDLKDGRLGRGRFASTDGTRFVQSHPDSNVKFSGLSMPHLEGAIRLCFKAAKCLPDIRSVGWDVAISKDGPVIVEGNATWGTLAAQCPGSGYFTLERRNRMARDGLPLPSEKLPSTFSTIKYHLRRRLRSR